MEYIEVSLVDPRQISSQGRDGATVMVIGALYRGEYMADNAGSMPSRVRAIDHNIGEMTHSPTDRRALHKKSGDHGGAWQFYYCSRCGGKFNLKRCIRCGVTFTIGERDILDGSFPNIPPKVVKYATSHGHKFAKRPPRP